MAPENANIFFLDDNADYLDTMKEKLEEAGHSVLLTAHTKQEAMEAISQFDKHHINVAVLDRNLDIRDDHNIDGEQVGQTIRETHPEVIIIGNSRQGLKCADINTPEKGSSSVLAEIVTNA